MSLRHLMNLYARPEVGLDPRLKALDCRVHGLVYDKAPWTIRELAEAVGRTFETVRASVERLERVGWVFTHLPAGRRRGRFVYASMPPEVELQVASILTQRRTSVLHFSEWLMRCLLDYLVADWTYFDNAHPDWLITPKGARLQLDRWYVRLNVAFEFQGPQHFQKGDRFVTSDEALSRRLQYDGEKLRLCALQGIELIEVRAADLEFDRFQQLLAGKLPLVPVRPTGHLARQLVGMTRQYIRHVQGR